MADTYTVKKGDTLSGIAQANLSTIGASSIYGDNGGIALLCKWNNISNPNYIVVGQVLKLTATASGGSSSTPAINNSNKPIIELFGLQSNTENTIFASWKWGKSHTKEYEVMWYYATGDGIWFVGTKSTSEFKQSTYSTPSNATKIKFKVKAISETYKSNDKDVNYWIGDWSTERIYNMSDNPPKKPSSAPDVELDGYKLTAKYDNLDLNATSIYFEVATHTSSVFQTGTAKIKNSHAEFTWTISAGKEYKVRARSVRGDLKSDWSEYSDSKKSIPAATKITVIKGSSNTSIYLEWNKIATATSYEVEYAALSNTFDGTNTDFGGSDETSSFTSDYNYFEKTGLESGKEYFFRVRAVNESGESPWSEIKSIVIGKAPTAPTTWSSSTTVITGEPLTLYWVHNSRDASSQVAAVIQLEIDGKTEEINYVNDRPEEEKDKTSFYDINTSLYLEGTQIKWKVKTRGITGEYGEWSVERTIDIYAPPALQLSVTDVNAAPIETLDSFPFYIQATPSPDTQTATGYHLSITANEPYETVDQYGNTKLVSEGEAVYSKQFNTNANLLVIISAENITLENNINYTVTCTVSMNSGLTAVSSVGFKVAWSDDIYVPNAEIGIDTVNYTANIRPYIEDENGELIDGILLSVYRREFDGGFVELIKDVKNTSQTFITDPHPALDFARYRIVAKTESTGKVTYTDLPGYPVGGKAIIIQWDEEWTTFDSPEAEAMEHPEWTGSMLQLLYNIDVSENAEPDVERVEYIGRSHPTNYYGTQLGSTATWNVEIESGDSETLYALRRLQRYTGDVYVREPSGSGYWANVKVSFNQNHCELTIPVTLSISRAEGGA